MNKRQLPSHALPNLRLSPSEEQDVITRTNAMVQRALVLEREFHHQGARINEREWKEITAVDNFRVYRPRTPKKKHRFSIDKRRTSTNMISSSGTWHSATSTSTTEEEEIASTSRNFSHVMCAGYLEGTLEDFLFGSFDGDERSWKIRAAYMKDKFADSRIFAKIVRPTPEEPYRFVGIKWFAVEVPAIIDSFLHMRDTFVMESTGMADDEDGVPYAYFLFHDYDHPDLPELTEFGIIRNRLSICFIARQIAPDRIYIHARGYVNVGGDVIKSVGLTVAGVSLASTANSIEASYGKKLTWLMSRHLEQRRALLVNGRGHSHECHACQKPTNKLLSRSSACNVCGFTFCSKCTVHRKVVADVETLELSSKALSFCYPCVIKAKKYHPHEIALDTLVPATMSRKENVSRRKAFSTWVPPAPLGAY
ncbi:hypothetical protein Poli38472_012563 [Pythium oligandrum]|uniref:FYVE-type domain-containing protein n=1 Tax=Pythium oligandrum TaxID=41045 RepID=A0A8K1CDP1_PYTOL|nr:hypothetical protein Poli38472_012563 [Pythium oligandrum]|eukprot:TMW61372.1 hypothetical protein Poli38472_012563 [Pythium oligandrum]